MPGPARSTGLNVMLEGFIVWTAIVAGVELEKAAVIVIFSIGIAAVVALLLDVELLQHNSKGKESE